MDAAAIVGAGVTTPLGLSLEDFWANLCAGRTAVARHEPASDAAGRPVVAAAVPEFDAAPFVSRPEARRLDPAHLFAIAAADAALAACPDRPEPARCAIVCGVGLGAAATLAEQHRIAFAQGMRGLSPFAIPLGMPSSVAATLAMRHGFEGPCRTVSSACASGADAIGLALGMLRHGEADLVLAGGVDALLTVPLVLGFLRMGALSTNPDPVTASRPFDRDRDGFVLAEGAGFVVLCRERDVRTGGGAVLGLVAGYGSTCDAHHLVAPREDGRAAARCVEAALADAGLAAGDIGHVNAHGTSTPRNDLAEATALGLAFSGRVPPVTAVKGGTGHMVGASGAVEAIATALSLRARAVPPTAGWRHPDPCIDLDVVAGSPRPIGSAAAVSTSFGFGGHNAALVLTRP